MEEQYIYINQPTQTLQNADLSIIRHVILHPHKINFEYFLCYFKIISIYLHNQAASELYQHSITHSMQNAADKFNTI
jgi:hypothetical protein